MNCLSGKEVEPGMKTRIALSARVGLVDRAEHGPMVAGETHIADEVGRGRLVVVLGGRRDEVGDCCKADLVSLALRKKGRREGEWAQREQTRWLGDCERTSRSVLKAVAQKEIRGRESLCSLPVRLEEDESLHYGSLMIEALPSVRLTKWQECCHSDSCLALFERAIVHDKVQLRAGEIWGLANSLFEEAIYHDSSNLLQQDNCGSL